jgi:hypothetical protein
VAGQLVFGQTPNPADPKPKRLSGQAGGERPGGSRYTVTADSSLNDVSTQRAGNEYYVTIPNADASRIQSGLRGRGYENVQVLRQGSNVVLKFSLQPGADARVSQRANRVDVVFTLPGGEPDRTIYPGDDPSRTDTSHNNPPPASNPGYPLPPGDANATQRGNANPPPGSPRSNPNSQASASPGRTPDPNSATQGNAPDNAQTNPNAASANNGGANPPASGDGAATRSQASRWSWWRLAVAVGIFGVGLLLWEFLVRRRARRLGLGAAGAENALPEAGEPVFQAHLAADDLHDKFAVWAGTSTDSTSSPASSDAALAISEETGKADTAMSDNADWDAPPSDELDYEAGSDVAAAPAAGDLLVTATPVADFDDDGVEIEVKRLLAGERYSVETLENGSPEVRRYVAQQLEAAARGPAAKARERALEAFVAYGFMAAARQQVSAGETPQLRAAAARSLSLVNDETAVSELTTALSDPAPEVRCAAIQSLSALRARAAVGPLRELLQTETDPSVPHDMIEQAIDACAEESPVSVAEMPFLPSLEIPIMPQPTPPDFNSLTDLPSEPTASAEDRAAAPRPVMGADLIRAEAEKARARVEAEMRRRDQDLRRELEAKLQAEAEARQKAEAEMARLRAEAEERARRVAEQEARVKADADAARQAAEAAARQAAEEEQARRAELEARRQADEAEAQRQAEETRRRLAEEAARHQAEEDARLQAEADARRQAEEQLTRLRAELEAQRQAREEAARRRAEAEAARREAEAAARQKAEEEARLRAEAEERARQLEEARRQAEEEARRQMEAELARQRAEEEARLQAEAEARRRAEEEAARLRAELEAQQQAEEEAARRRAEEEARRQAELEARLQAEAEARRRAEEEAARLEAEAEAVRRRAEEEAQRLAAEEMQRQAEAEARIRAEADARRQLEDELAQLQAEAEAARHEAEAEEAALQAEEEARERAEAEAMAAYERVENLTAQFNFGESAALAPPIETVEFAEAEAPVEDFGALTPTEELAAGFEEDAAQEQARLELQRRLQEEVERRQAIEAEMARLLEEEEAARAAEDQMAQLHAAEEASLRADDDDDEAAEAARKWDAVNEAQNFTAPADELVLEEAPVKAEVEPEWSEYDSEFVLAPMGDGAPESEAEAAAATEGSQPVVVEDLALLPEPEGSEPAAPSYQAPAFAPASGDDAQIPAELLADLQSGQPETRAGATLALSRLGLEGDETFNTVCQMFDDPIQSVRDAAARALYSLNRDRAATFTRALREASPDRRRSIGVSMSASGLADEAISNLVDESREKTYDAFSFLFLMSKAGEVQPLVRAIKDHPSKDVRLAVVRLLALSGQPEVLPAFRRLAVRGSLPTEVRSAVMEAIFQISSQQSADAPKAE